MKTILIVDDNPQNLYMLQVLLSGNGFQVVQASNGAEALEQARSAPPDIIISDILMPVMDGFALCRACKQDERLKDVPFIFYTATYTDAKDEDFALSLGADRFIVKPAEPTNFLFLVKEVLKKDTTQKSVASPLPVEETTYYKQYNATLIRKLEDKMQELEETNRILELDIAARKRTEEVLRQSENKYRTLVENIPQKIFFKNKDSAYVSCNWQYANDLKINSEGISGKTDYDLFPKELADKYRADDLRVMESGQTEDMEELHIKDGAETWIWTIKTPVRDEKNTIIGVLGIFWDITERKRAEMERQSLQDQMIQAQKMESVGRLAGGIAHDFNNMLGVILGCAELAQFQLDPTHPLSAYIKEIQLAAQRSAELTRQLLAFARRQPVSRKMLDLNNTMTGMLKMLQRLIGEDIDLVWNPRPGLWPIEIDPSQVDQILANLCVNARDAIAGAGRVVIATDNVVFDTVSCRQVEGLEPGEYIKLTVGDSGSGMDKETLAHLFEPFFTTKAVGKGTGLGLATVYGAVKQNGGHIHVSSEPDHGTTFDIYLPRHTAAEEEDDAPAHPASSIHGHETVLLVEDEAQLMKLARTMLESLGYQVLSAISPSEAIRLSDEHANEIHLLITDLVMPEMNGCELSKVIEKRHPHIKPLFISGYASDVIDARGGMEGVEHFLQKPFTVNELGAKVREALG